MSEGHVYILYNRAMRGLLKIGKTTRLPDERARELSADTAVPAPFYVAYSCRVSNCDLAEELIHRELKAWRQSEDREFFSLELEVAIKVVESIAWRFQPDASKPRLADPPVPPLEEPRQAPPIVTPPPGVFPTPSPSDRFGARRGKESQPSPPKMPASPQTATIEVTCGACRHPYSITLRRYHSRVTCPVCRHSEDVAVPWDRWWANLAEDGL